MNEDYVEIEFQYPSVSFNKQTLKKCYFVITLLDGVRVHCKPFPSVEDRELNKKEYEKEMIKKYTPKND